MKWHVRYHDGTTYNEDDLGSSEQIDRSRLAEFRLAHEGKVVFVALFDKGSRRKLIFRRRNMLTATGQPMGSVYLVGWHENVKGVSVKSICYIYEDGHIEFDHDRSDLQLVPCET